MDEKKEKYLSSGEFARLCKVNKQTLFYYDQIGLLSPIFKNEKGYRFYSVHQLDLFNVIDLLKELDMSLKEIQNYMKNKSPESFLHLMYQKRADIVKKRQEIEMKEKIIEAKIKLMEEASHWDFTQVTIEQLPKATLYLSKNIENISNEKFVEVVSDFINELYQSNLDSGYPIGVITKREHILNREFTKHSFLYIEQPIPREGHKYFQIVKGDFLVGYHVGDEETIPQTYERLLMEMERLQLRLGNYVFEEYVYDHSVKSHEEEFVTKIMMQIER
ncbi:MerR family transcriptional regulator [Ornithinibacillus halotolerans]|uniref:Multidrug-efflux transporter 2 regulator n=1 Tax=Ornithinibacillus halotolerans TaxID=1274357 RepID=A0A916RYI3_9BACI|nr:MerR family transcriptional regulator [Ornithinibacillus halotolerans]GGA75647.1 multidrug-efflux transporter 2 regulator [Ornithinibacillus halotolerans]